MDLQKIQEMFDKDSKIDELGSYNNITKKQHESEHDYDVP